MPAYIGDNYFDWIKQYNIAVLRTFEKAGSDLFYMYFFYLYIFSLDLYIEIL